jgi:hypothetical protein
MKMNIIKIIKKLRELKEYPEFHQNPETCLFAEFLADRVEWLGIRRIDPIMLAFIAMVAVYDINRKSEDTFFPDAYKRWRKKWKKNVHKKTRMPNRPPPNACLHPRAGKELEIQKIIAEGFPKIVNAIFPWWWRFNQRTKKRFIIELLQYGYEPTLKKVVQYRWLRVPEILLLENRARFNN